MSSSGPRALAGTHAIERVREEARKAGLDPEPILKDLRAKNESAILAMHLLGLKRSDVVFDNRPPETRETLFIRQVVERLTDHYLSKSKAFKYAPRYLADPALRAREKIDFSDMVVTGHRGALLSQKSLRSRYALSTKLFVELWFETVPDETEAIFPIPGAQ